jgi:hypothetical protein
MQMRWSQARGTLILDDTTQETLGFIDSPLINVDTGVIVGFFVRVFYSSEMLFLQTQDIVSWGISIHIRSIDHLGESKDFFRLSRFFEDPRFFLKQKIYYDEPKEIVGICSDVQFSTRHFRLEWMFPRRWFFFAREPIAISEVLEVTADAIFVRPPLRGQKIEEPLFDLPAPSLPPELV